MNYQLIESHRLPEGITQPFIEGAIFASNLAVKPIAPEEWLSSIALGDPQAMVSIVTEQINRQHNLIQRSEYSINEALSDGNFTDDFVEFSEGFMTVWSTVEKQWQDVAVSDGSLRMLQALLTTFMLAIDEEQTQQQMRDAGLSNPPKLNDLVGDIDLMVVEVGLAADEAMLGNKSQSVNPFKGIGRNDLCPCESGKKFKQCCGKGV